MSNVPKPEKGSVGLWLTGVPSGLPPGFYLDEDVALKVNAAGVMIIAPNMEQAKLISASLRQTAMSWRAYLVSDQELTIEANGYAAWLKLAAKFATTGELESVSRESDSEAKPVYLAAS